MLAIVYCLSSLAVAINVIRPRLFRNSTHGHIFWEDIAASDKRAYAESFPSLTAAEIVRELGDHNHNMASSAHRKFRWLRTGFYLALSSICFSAIVILFTITKIVPGLCSLAIASAARCTSTSRFADSSVTRIAALASAIRM